METDLLCQERLSVLPTQQGEREGGREERVSGREGRVGEREGGRGEWSRRE